MGYYIERENVARITLCNFPDGMDLVGEALEYNSNCGCKVIFGVRHKGGEMEKCLTGAQCDKHPNVLKRILEAGDPTHHMYDKDTDEVVAWAIMFGGS